MKDIGAIERDHTTFAKKLNEIVNDGLWVQAVTVTSEHQSGKREPGQRADRKNEVKKI